MGVEGWGLVADDILGEAVGVAGHPPVSRRTSVIAERLASGPSRALDEMEQNLPPGGRIGPPFRRRETNDCDRWFTGMRRHRHALVSRVQL